MKWWQLNYNLLSRKLEAEKNGEMILRKLEKFEID
jgi:hypothetical protein